MKIGNIVTIKNAKNLHAGAQDMIGMTGKIIDIDPYSTPPIKIQLANLSEYSFYLYNIELADISSINLYNKSTIINDAWKTI